MNNLMQRVLVGAVGIPLFVTLIWLGGWWFSGLMMLLSLVGLNEYYSLAAAKGLAPSRVVGFIATGVLMALLSLLHEVGFLRGIGYILLTFMCTAAVVLVTELWRNREQALANVATTFFGIMYLAGGLGSMVLLSRASFSNVPATENEGSILILTLFVSIWICDSAAYFAGRAFGKHKLWLRVSPGKSWEGAIVGGLAAIAAFAHFPSLFIQHYNPWMMALCGLIVAVFGQLGDLGESLLKRDANIKDSSTLIPGHGGVLDRFDSILVAAPLVLAVIVLWTQS